MIAKEELDRITAAQLKSWSENRGVIGVNAVPPLRTARLNWLAKMRKKLATQRSFK